MKEYYSVDAVSNSGMGAINPDQGGSPLKYKTYVVDRLHDKEETPSLKNGTLIHAYVEDPTKFILADINKPSEMMSGWVEDIYEACKEAFIIEHFVEDNKAGKIAALEYRKDRYKTIKDEDLAYQKFIKEGKEYLEFLYKAEDKIVLDTQTKEIVENSIAGIHRNTFANELLFKEGEDFGDVTYNELPIYFKEQGLDCKALLDRVRISPSNKTVQLIDLKTTSKPVSLFQESFRKYRYYRQMAFYKKALTHKLSELYPDIDNWLIEVYIVCVETYGVHECLVYKVQDAWITEGQGEWKNLLRLINNAKDNNWDSETIKRLYYEPKE